jgi:Mg2+-importing ATPase
LHVPFNYLLLTLAGVALLTQDYKGAIVITCMVALSGLLRFWQEYRSGQAAEQLRALVRTTATVCRPDPWLEVPAEVQASFGLVPPPPKPRQEERPIRDLAPGDVVHLSAGDLIPADVRLLSTRDLFVSQAALTGESLPVEKLDVPPAEARRLLEAHVSRMSRLWNCPTSVSWAPPWSAGPPAPSWSRPANAPGWAPWPATCSASAA